MAQLLAATSKNRGLILDPRAKLLTMISIAVFTMGGVGCNFVSVQWISRLLGFLPLLLLLTVNQWRKVLVYGSMYALLTIISVKTLSDLRGSLQIFTAICCMAVLRFMPGLIMGSYILSSTTVSEFIAAFHRMHIPPQIIIPLSVMFRFFPTVSEEFASINAAMKMRDICLGGKNAKKIVEYRIVPLLVCSVTIGQELSAAALTRGLSPDKKRTNICSIGFHVQDIFLIAIALLPIILVIFSASGVMK